MEPSPSHLELIRTSHEFPGPYLIKVIGDAKDDFPTRVLAAIREELGVEPQHEVRSTPGGRHVSVTLHPTLDSAEQVLAIHHRLKKLDGLVMLL